MNKVCLGVRTAIPLVWRVCCVGALVPLLASMAADAATYAVACDVTDLVAKIRLANDESNSPGPDVLNLAANCTYSVQTPAASAGGRFFGLPFVTSDITINGNAAIIERSGAAANAFGFFFLADLGSNGVPISAFSTAAKLTLSNLTLRNGTASAITNLGTLTLLNSTITGNSATVDGFGGGLVNGGKAMLTGTVVDANQAVGDDGGGIFNQAAGTLPGELTLINTVVSNNVAGGEGGGISNAAGIVSLTDSTVSGNRAGDLQSIGQGGGIQNSGTLAVVRSTVSGNQAIIGSGIFIGGAAPVTTVANSTISGNEGFAAGAIYVNNTASSSQPLTMSASTVSLRPDSGGIFNNAGNPAVALNNVVIVGDASVVNCWGLVTGTGISTDGSCTGLVQVADAKLGPLADNGGPTLTHALLDGSPAINAAASCGGLATDQRGVARPQGAACDLGAFELAQSTYTFRFTVGKPPRGGFWVVNAGATASVKFSLGGNFGSDIFASGYPASQQVDCQTLAPIGTVTPAQKPGGTSLQYDPTTSEYTYLWKTSSAWAGTCRQLTLVFNDGSRGTALYQFK